MLLIVLMTIPLFLNLSIESQWQQQPEKNLDTVERQLLWEQFVWHGKNNKQQQGQQRANTDNDKQRRQKRFKQSNKKSVPQPPTPTIISPNSSLLPIEEDTIPTVQFIPHEKLKRRHSDFFSATWWQSKDRFLRTFDPSRIDSCEGATFQAILSNSVMDDLRMTVDWLKFSVEHLSKNWKLTGIEHKTQTASYEMYVEKLLSYIDRTLVMEAMPMEQHTQQQQQHQQDATALSITDRPRTSSSSSLSFLSSQSSSSSSAMQETIAVVSFMPYRNRTKSNTERYPVLTVANLAAALTAMIRVECGRVLIAMDQEDLDKISASIIMATQWLLLQNDHNSDNDGIPRGHQQHNATHRRLVLESFLQRDTDSEPLPSLLSLSTMIPSIDAVLSVNQTNPIEFQVHRTEIALVVVNCTVKDGTKRDHLRIIPKAALMNLKKAFDVSDLLHTRQWLGRTSSSGSTGGHGRVMSYNDKWNYTYLTEPDTILHVRLEALPAFRRELEHGKILAPHRLQPIPHARDMPQYAFPDRMLPVEGNFSHVHSLGTNAMCCDDGQQVPWSSSSFAGTNQHHHHHEHCGHLWWLCGFLDKETKQLGRHRHFRLEHYKLVDLQQGTRIVTLAGGAFGRRCNPRWTTTSLGTGLNDNDCHY